MTCAEILLILGRDDDLRVGAELSRFVTVCPSDAIFFSFGRVKPFDILEMPY